MSKGKKRVKGITSSGAKSKQKQKATTYKQNYGVGVNPNTGKEFFILNITDKISVNATTYQTRLGADSVRTNKQMVVEKSNLINHLDKWKQKRIDFTEIKQYLPNKWQFNSRR